MDLAGEEHVHDPLHIEHVHRPIPVDIRTGYDCWIGLNPQEHIHA